MSSSEGRAEALADTTIRLVYWTILLVGVSYGLAISLIAVFLEGRGFDKDTIGDLAIFFAGGIVSFAIPSGWAIRRFGPKKVLVAGLVGYALAVGLFPFAGPYAALATLRFFDGAFSVAVWVSSETVLLSRAPREDKAFFMSLYAIALAIGYVVGPIASRGVVAVATKSTSFYVAGALALCTALVVAARMRVGSADGGEEVTLGDKAQPTTPLTTGQIFWRIKMSCLATFSYGYFQASVVLFLPLYLKGQGLTEGQTIIVPAFFAAGMLLLANFVARWGDRFGHLFVMRALGVIGTVTIVCFLFVKSAPVVYMTGFVAGASLASLSPVSLALLGIAVPERQLSQAGGLYNAAYALGMLVGPPIAGRLFKNVSGFAMLIHFAVLWTGFVALSILFRRDDPRR
ncbi:MAG: MFS transporter [Polyangiaceae bacterium]|nr:MFS transporter [Polyangiaceae bacterium]